MHNLCIIEDHKEDKKIWHCQRNKRKWILRDRKLNRRGFPGMKSNRRDSAGSAQKFSE